MVLCQQEEVLTGCQSLTNIENTDEHTSDRLH